MFSKLKNKTWFKIVSNRYVILVSGFIIWMFFFDSNSFFIHQELNDEINDLEDNIEYFENEISKDKEVLNVLKDSNELEKFAREKFYLKKENEEIFIIEIENDSLKTKKDE